MDRLTYRTLLLAFVAISARRVSAQETAAVMPKSIFRVRAIQIMGDTIGSRLDGDGRAMPLLSPLNRSVSTKEMAASDPNLKQLYDALNAFRTGLGDSLFNANFETKSQIDFKRTIYALEYGITQRMSFGFMVPIYDMAIRSKFDVKVDSQIDKIRQVTAGLDPVQDGLDQAEASAPTTATFEKAVFTDKGYEVPGNYTVHGMSDAEIGLKYQIVNTEKFLFSGQLQFRLPTTSHTQDYTRLLDIGLGDKQLDVGAWFFADYMPTRDLVFGGMFRYTSQLADKKKIPFLKKGETGLADLTDPKSWDTATRNLGEMIETELATTYYFYNRVFNVYGAYQYAYKGADKYTGTKSNLDYKAMGVDTKTTTHKYEAGIGYGTIQAYFDKKFPVPFEVKYGYNWMFRGTNSPLVSYNRFNLLLYF